MGTKVRILTAVVLDGIRYQPDQVVDLPSATAKAQQAAGAVDPHKDAVAFCEKVLGAEVVVHKAPAKEAAAPSESTDETAGQAGGESPQE
jgi:hypothetical protein